MVLWLDDAHWADRATRDFLAFLAASLPDEVPPADRDRLPLRPAAPPPPDAAAAGRARPRRRVRRLELAPFGRARGRDAARRHPRRRPRPGGGRALLRARRRQPALHRGAARRRLRRPRPPALHPARRAAPADRTAAGGGPRAVLRLLAVAGRARTPAPRRRLRRRRGRARGGAARGGRGAGDPGRPRRPLRLPPRAPARGDLRRPAARRARRAPPEAGARRWRRRWTSDDHLAIRAAAVAHHFNAAGDQPQALRSAVAAARAVERGGTPGRRGGAARPRAGALAAGRRTGDAGGGRPRRRC